MAITNKEIISNQLKRINEKIDMDFVLEGSDDELFLASSDNNVLFENMEMYRTEDQMFEYLAGLEDAIDYFIKQKK